MANASTENINIYVVTYNCNDMKLTGDATSIENFVTSVINNKVHIYNTNQKTMVETTNVNVAEKNIFIFGIQESPYVSSDKYKHMLTTIITKLNNNNNTTDNYNYYYFDKTTISKTKLFIIYNDKNINVDDEKFIDLSRSVINKFNKHALRVIIKHNDTAILTVITTHLRKGNLAPFFINDLKKLIEGTEDNIILFGDLNSRTLYKAPGSHNFESYNDVKSSKITHIKKTLESLDGIPLSFLNSTDRHFINTLKHKKYYHSGKNNKFSNATNTLKNPTYRYKPKSFELNYSKNKNHIPIFKVPSYPDRVLFKSDNKLTLIKDSAHVLEYTGSDHLPVIVKFNYEIEQASTNNIYFMRHGHSCSNFVKYLQTRKQNSQLQSRSEPYNITHKLLKGIAKPIKKTHTLIKNPNLSYTGYLQTQNFVNWCGTRDDNIFKLNNNNNNNNLIVFCSPLVRAMETAFFSYPYSINGDTIIYRTFSYEYYNFDGKLDAITNLKPTYIYVLPFIKEVGITPDNAMPTIEDSKTKFQTFLDLINVNVDTSLFINVNATNLTFINKLTTNYKILLTQFINKLTKENNKYVFVSHHQFIKDYLKYNKIITNTMILNSNGNIIYTPTHITNDTENENENENICISGVHINSLPTIPVSLEKQQEAYKSQLSNNYQPIPLFNIL